MNLIIENLTNKCSFYSYGYTSTVLYYIIKLNIVNISILYILYALHLYSTLVHVKYHVNIVNYIW